jgi:hypothetical protein
VALSEHAMGNRADMRATVHLEPELKSRPPMNDTLTIGKLAERLV